MGLATMNIFGRLERLLASLVEGTVERWFVPGVQPVQLARRLEAAMEEGALVGTRGPLAPNAFVVTLDPASYARFGGALAGIQRELEQHLVAAAARRRLRTLAAFSVELRSDPALTGGNFTVQAAFVANEANPKGEDAAVEGQRPEHTLVMPVALEHTAPIPLAALDILGPDGTVRTVPITGEAFTLGRAEDNALALRETAVSRHHAVIRHAAGRFVVEDQGSTNGVLVNGQQVKSAELQDGDRLLLGTVELVFRRL